MYHHNPYVYQILDGKCQHDNKIISDEVMMIKTVLLCEGRRTNSVIHSLFEISDLAVDYAYHHIS